MGGTEPAQQAGSGTFFLILIQVASRALTFIGNQFLLRFLSPALLGIAVQLELVSVTSLYFARESLRVALQRQAPSPAHASTQRKDNGAGNETQTVVNLSYLAVLLGFGISTIFGYSYLQNAANEVLESPVFDLSFRTYAAATLIELLAEPAFVVIQQKAMFKDRARAETSAATARCLVACIVAAIGHRNGQAPSILPFAVGQAAYAIVLLGLYVLPTWQRSRSEKFSLTPRRLSSRSPPSGDSDEYYFGLFQKAILSLAATMYLQSVFKLLLTQGDSLIFSFLSSLADQGAFALASNYGGLLARLVFQPVEESSRNTFGRLLSPSHTISRGGSSSSARSSTSKASSNAPNPTAQALKFLSTTLHFYLLLALPLLSVAPYVLPVVVGQIIGADWLTPSTASLLATYCYYIPLMAVNGVLDAFVTSVATPAQLRAQSVWMLLFTALYGAAAWSMLKIFDMGAVGLVAANMLNMALRIVWSAVFIRAWVTENEKDGGQALGQQTVADSLPSIASIAVAGLVVVGLRFNPLGASILDHGELNHQFLGLLTGATVVLGSTM